MLCCGLPLSAEGYVDDLFRWPPRDSAGALGVGPGAGAGLTPASCNTSGRRADSTSTPLDMEVHTLPNALVTGSPERVPDITIALKSAGFDILSAGAISPEDVPDLEANSVDCYVQLPVDPPAAGGGALRRTRDVLAHEMVSRFDAAAQFLPLLAPTATVLLVTEDFDGLDDSAGRLDPDQKAVRTIVGVLAEAILRDCGRSGVRTAVIAGDRASHEIAALASHRPPEPLPWWLYATVDPDLDFADWRNSILCLASLRDG